MARYIVCFVFVVVTLPMVAAPLTGKLFRSTDKNTTIKILSHDQLELANAKGRYLCSYSQFGDSLHAVTTSLGFVQAFTFKMTAEGLVTTDGAILYDESHFDAAGNMLKLPKNVVFAPRPEYPNEARTRHITGSGVVVLTVDVATGAVIDASMSHSIGNPILDNAAVAAYRHWRFKPGTAERKMYFPVTFTMTGASY